MSLIQLLWCAFALIIVVLAWVTLHLDRAVEQQMRLREAMTSQLSMRHCTMTRPDHPSR